MNLFQIFLFCMVIEEYNPPQCQEEVQDCEEDESKNIRWDEFLFMTKLIKSLEEKGTKGCNQLIESCSPEHFQIHSNAANESF